MDRHCLFGLFQIGELAGQNLLAGEVSLPRLKSLRNQVGGALQIDESHFGTDFKFSAVAALQSGAGKDYILVVTDPLGNRGSKSCQPWLAMIRIPTLVLAGPEDGWKSSASANSRPHSSARRRPTVVLPAPTTPITIRIIGEDCSRIDTSMWG